MEKKQLVELIVTAVAVVILVFSLIFGSKKKPVKKTVLSSESGAVALVASVQDQAKATDANKINAQKERIKLAWGRNPFAEPSQKEYRISELELKGVSLGRDEKGGYAFINNEIVSRGDKVGDYEVIEVEKDKVLLKKGNQNFYLVFPEE